MLQGLGATYSQGWVDLQAASDEVAELWLVVEDLVDSFEADDVLPVLDALVRYSLVNLVALEHLGELILAAFGHPRRHFGLLRVLEDHKQVLKVIMGGEEKITGVHFRDDAADGPHIARILPITALQDDLRRAILPSINDGAMSFLGMRRPSKIDQLDLIRPRQHIILHLRMRDLLQILTTQQDILGLEIRMGILIGMHEGN